MLTCYDHRVRLPQNGLAYVGFRLAVLDTLCQMETAHKLSDDESVAGYLAEVPFLEATSPAVQVDLLAGVWRRHRDAVLHEASLLDAAVVYAAFHSASGIITEMPALARFWLKAGPRPARARLGPKTAARLQNLFFAFWDDIDFLSLGHLQDLNPEQAQEVKDLLGLPGETIDEMEQALSRWRASPGVLANLEGLLTAAEIQDYAGLLTRAEG